VTVARRVSSPEFVGRALELASLLDALEHASGGEFATVFVAGDSGVGKSRLLDELSRAARASGARVLAGDCVSFSAGELPYAPIRSALRGLARELDREVLDGLLGPGRDDLARLVPELAAPGSLAPAESATAPLAQPRLFELLLGVVSRVGESSPVLLAIEDIHWADRSTLDFLAFLMANARRERLLLVCSYRTDALHRRHPLRSFLAQSGRPPAVERLELRAFTREELAAQLRGILEQAPDRALVDRLYARSEGNAFFTEELLAASADGGELPPSLRDALLMRIEVLPERVQQVLRVAAAHARVVPHRLLAAVCDLPEWELHDALRAALADHVLVRHDEDNYAFRHALLQETLASDLLPGERITLHLTLAQALEVDSTLVSADGRAAAELYGHWLGARRLPEALAAAVRAGVEAEQVYAFADASHHFQRALKLWDQVDAAERRSGMAEGDLCARAAEAASLSGDGEQAIRLIQTAIERADVSSDRYRAALLRERLGHYLFAFVGDVEAAQDAFREAVDLLPQKHPRRELARALAALGQILMLRGRTAESMERCEQAIAVARQVGARAEEAHALNTLGVDLGFLGDRGTGIDYLRESLHMSEEIGDIDGLGRAYCNLGEMLDQDGRIEEAAEVARAGAARAAELGMRDRRALLEGEAATRLVILGRLEEADRLTEAALELRPSIAKLDQCATRAQVEVHRGHVAEADILIRAADEGTRHVPGATWIEPLASTRVELELLRGRPEEACRQGERMLELVGDDEKVVFTARLHAVTARAGAVLAERARAAGDQAAATEAAARAQALADRIERLLAAEQWRGTPPPETLAYRELCAAEAQRAAGGGAASDWAAVADRCAPLGMVLEEAYARLRQAECLVLDGDRARAGEVVIAALRLTRRAGAAWLQDQLEALARRGRLSLVDGTPPVVPAAVERHGLTERELAVLELVARGLTNRQIGEQLFMAQKTASVHVSRILAKLNVSTRVEAATAAQRLGIVP
jgi:DNA-binding CsgD family transcriptional regulator/tetratricopeptide (TPR) repeat protein